MSDMDFEMETGLDFEATTDVHLTDPASGKLWHDDKGKPVTITVISGNSETFQRAAWELQARFAIRIKNNTGPWAGRANYEQQKQYKAELYALVMRDWHIAKKNGGPALNVSFTHKNAINWCKANPLFAEQLTRGSDDLQSFVKDIEGNFISEESTLSAKPSKQKSD